MARSYTTTKLSSPPSLSWTHTTIRLSFVSPSHHSTTRGLPENASERLETSTISQVPVQSPLLDCDSEWTRSKVTSVGWVGGCILASIATWE